MGHEVRLFHAVTGSIGSNSGAAPPLRARALKPTRWRWSTAATCIVYYEHPAGAAIVNAIGPIRQTIRPEQDAPRRFLVIAPGQEAKLASAMQIQTD
jgi:hypothetical protein